MEGEKRDGCLVIMRVEERDYFHGAFRGSSKTHNLLKSGEPAGTRTQGPRLKRAGE